MRLVFAGTPAPAVPSLRSLASSDHEIVAVISRPDAPLGRKRVLTPSPTSAAATELGLPILPAARLDDEVSAQVRDLAPDLGVIVAYGGLVREPLLSTPRLGWINLHFSLLPRWRGAAPVQHALITGDRVVGASVFQLVAGLDAGDVFGEISYDVPEGATAGDVLTALADVGADLLRDVVDGLAEGSLVARPQVGEPTLAPKLTLDDGRLRWSEPSALVLARFRGTTPEPGAHTSVNGARLKVIDAVAAAEDGVSLPPGVLRADGRAVLVGTADRPIRLVRVQPAGKPVMDAGDWWRGLRVDELAVDDVRVDERGEKSGDKPGDGASGDPGSVSGSGT